VRRERLTLGDADPLHGYALSPADRALLRADPPARALRWCEALAGSAVAAVRALDGGTSSAVHALDLADGRAFVLRRFVRQEWLAEEPEAPAREAAALDLLRACDLPTPELVGLDPDGAAAGDPAVLMTRLPGALTWRPPDLDAFLARLAALLPAIHATPVDGRLAPYALWLPATSSPPSWTARPAIWERAFATFSEPPPTGPAVLLHRDFHPGNVLWVDGAVSGVVDWPNACVGVAESDVGYCRRELVRVFGLEAADRFLRRCGVRDYDPYWDIVAALGGFDDAVFAAWAPREEEFLARAVAARAG
jgi:aminoglycoside phosphotransferase (APT) family kinase protein